VALALAQQAARMKFSQVITRYVVQSHQGASASAPLGRSVAPRPRAREAEGPGGNEGLGGLMQRATSRMGSPSITSAEFGRALIAMIAAPAHTSIDWQVRV